MQTKYFINCLVILFTIFSMPMTMAKDNFSHIKIITSQQSCEHNSDGVSKGEKRSSPLWLPSRFHTAKCEIQLIKSWQTHNHIPVYFTATSWLPILDIEITFYAGSARDEQHQGIAYLTNRMLTEKLNHALMQHLETAGTLAIGSVQRDTATLHIRTTTTPQALKALLPVLKENFNASAFSEKVLEQNKRQVNNQHLLMAQSHRELAKMTLYQNIFNSHPYGHSLYGTDASIKTIATDDLQHFYQQYYVSNNAIIAMSGALSSQQAQAIAEAISTCFAGGQTAAALVKANINSAKTGLTFIPNKSSTQSHIYLGMLVSTPLDEDFLPLLIGNYILGVGATTSYLGKELRVKHGLAYNIHSEVIPYLANGILLIGLQTKTKQTKQAFLITRHALENFIQQGPSETDVELAKKHLIGHLPLNFDSNKKIVQQLTYLGVYKLPSQYFANFNQQVANISAGQVKATLQKYINSKNMVIVIVGRQQ